MTAWFFGVLALALVTFTASASAVLKADPAPQTPGSTSNAAAP